QVFFTTIAPNPAVNISPTASATVKGNLLANVAFELLKPAASPSFQVDGQRTSFVDSSATVIPGVVAGPPITESLTNKPPTASFIPTPLLPGDTSCVAVTGLVCDAFAYKFDGTASTDTDGTIAAPQGYFWDFGDGTQDNVNNAGCGLANCNQGSTAIHDYPG